MSETPCGCVAAPIFDNTGRAQAHTVQHCNLHRHAARMREAAREVVIDYVKWASLRHDGDGNFGPDTPIEKLRALLAETSQP